HFDGVVQPRNAKASGLSNKKGNRGGFSELLCKGWHGGGIGYNEAWAVAHRLFKLVSRYFACFAVESFSGSLNRENREMTRTGNGVLDSSLFLGSCDEAGGQAEGSLM
ncbi:MAG: hypothetical protein NTV46_03760, partial [Verrucomicrobia bacterium]|nr:hypothetical protein [Verrucomicrobiota bacterium]